MTLNSNTRKPRLDREARTIEAMIYIFCEKKHGLKGELCTECQELLDYAHLRLQKCPFQEEKSTCANCRIHCYRPDMRERVREVMRFSGPHMLYRHPILAFMHLVVDERRPAPDPPKARRSQA
ncbi:MAG: nitrous oxide-stimulated promoter family protein [Chloroflexi bacterium]|nr:MAG: nitrous oxide-stimulated promoter family protein [Chloroflexota bacterium]